MVTLELKQLVMRNGVKMDYKMALGDILRTVAPLDGQGIQTRGFKDKDMEETEALAAKIEASNGSVDLTAAEVIHIADKVENAYFPMSDQALRQFIADIRELRNQ